jgi:hypothetical protein
MVVLKTIYEVMFFKSVIPSEVRQFKFKLSWLCDDHAAADRLRRKTFSTMRYDSHLSMLSQDYSFQRLTVYLLPPASWLTIRGWGRLSIQGADKRVKCSISHFLRAAVSCVETAHPSSLHASIMWFSCKCSPLNWDIGACTLRAQRISTSAVRRLRSLTGELVLLESSNQPRETRMSDLG